MPKNRFLTFNIHSGSDYLNPDWTWDVTAWYLSQFSDFPHANISLGPFTAYVWEHGFDGDEWVTPGVTPYAGLTTQQKNAFKSYLLAGGSFIYDCAEAIANIAQFPEITKDTGGYTLEDLLTTICKRFTFPFNPLRDNSVTVTPDPNKWYGYDAAYHYFGKDPGMGLDLTPTIGSGNLLEWWAAYLCGARRGEFNGKVSFGPNWLSILNWRDTFMNDFEQMPFLWAAGLLTMLTFKPMVNANEKPSNPPDIINWDKLPIEEHLNQRVWASTTPTERWNFLKGWMSTGQSNDIVDAPTRNEDMLRLACAISAKMGPYAKYNWTYPFTAESRINPVWRNYRLADLDVYPYQPEFMDQAHLQDSQRSSDSTAMGKYKELFAAGLSAIKSYTPPTGYTFNWGSDAAAMNYVENQYDGSVTVNRARVLAIAEYLADIDPQTTHWQIGFNEWNAGETITRPPNWVKISIDGETEYYTLSEAWWHMLCAIKDIALGGSIASNPLEPVVGPCEPLVYDLLESNDNVYRLYQWGQHDEYATVKVTWEEIKKQAQVLFTHAMTAEMGPVVPDPTSRLKKLHKVIWLWPMLSETNSTVHVNAAEILYIMAKAINNWATGVPEPWKVTILPSHILPHYYFNRLLWDGQYQLNMFGSQIENQMNWLELGQMWTLKPAVLKTAYR